MKKIALGFGAGFLLSALNASALNILLTNDDGWNSVGIDAMRTALMNAGHTVVLVAPLTHQSGMGGALNSNYNASIAVAEQSPGIWSVASTPADAVRAAIGNNIPGLSSSTPRGIYRNPDLVISGINEGQNLGQSGTWQSGTINAALQAVNSGKPAIAISAERLAKSDPIDTFNAMPGIGEFVVDLVARLDATRVGGQLLPPNTLLNVNYPVFQPSDAQQVPTGVVVTDLALKSNVDFFFSGDHTTGSMKVSIDFARMFAPSQYPAVNNDTEAFKANYVTVTLVDGDMSSKSASGTQKSAMTWRLNGLLP